MYKKCLLQKIRNFTKNPTNFYLLKKFHRESVKNESARAKKTTQEKWDFGAESENVFMKYDNIRTGTGLSSSRL